MHWIKGVWESDYAFGYHSNSRGVPFASCSTREGLFTCLTTLHLPGSGLPTVADLGEWHSAGGTRT